MAALAVKFQTKVLRLRLKGQTTREIGRAIKRSNAAVAEWLRSEDAITRLQKMRDAQDARIARKLADASDDAADYLAAVVRGKTKDGKVVKSSVSEKIKAAFGLLDRANQAPGVKVTVDATVRTLQLTDDQTLAELQEVLEMQRITTEEGDAFEPVEGVH